MRRQILGILLASALPLLAVPPVQPDPPDPVAGLALAQQICNAAPDETNMVQGTLFITAAGKTRAVPVVCRVAIHGAAWESEYDAAATTNSGAERLIVLHRANAPNEYSYARADSPAAPLPKPAPLSPADAASTPLAGSDFSAADLGLDFLHWPQQSKLKSVQRLGQPCYALESRDPSAKSIVRVNSYIDEECNAPILAEGYDARDHLVKVFSLSGSSFKRVNGHWHLENMGISDKRKRSHTDLKFDIVGQ